MEAADVLYGVTMGPDGVSQVVSRRLPQREPTARLVSLRKLALSRTWAELLGDEPTAGRRARANGVFARMRESLAKSRRALTAQARVRGVRPG